MKRLFSGTLALGASVEWWKEGSASMYQVYPRSFQDSCPGPLCDGTGDIQGLRSRLQYLVDNGVGYVWLSPVMRSPMKDFGYDISDYFDVDPLFGNMADLDDLIAEMHAKGLKIILDLVPNHTSEDHPWFVESRSNTTNAKRDWYIWHDAAGEDSPPNNWVSNFGGSAWTFDNTTNQSYYHAFGSFQPDLNYRNPEVVSAMEQIIEFWFSKAIDGFRVDAVPFLLEDPELKDEPEGSDYGNLTHIYTQNWDGIHNITQGWRLVADKFEGRALIGEIYAPLNITMEYYGNGSNEFHFPFNFQLITPDVAYPSKFIPIIQDYFDALPEGAWPNWVVGNHDQPRIMSKLHNDTRQQKALLTMLHMLPGTIVTYNGDEIAMKDTFIPYDECKDPSCINNPDDFVKKGRDPERTPMQWDCSLHAGFSDFNTTWLPLAPDYCDVNVRLQEKNSSSTLSLYRNVLAFRKTNPQIIVGKVTFLDVCNNEEAVAFQTETNKTAPLYVLVNFAQQNISCLLNGSVAANEAGVVLFATDLNKGESLPLHTAISLRPGEALVLGARAPTPAVPTTDWDTIRIALIIGGVFVTLGCIAIVCVWKRKKPTTSTGYDRIKEGRA